MDYKYINYKTNYAIGGSKKIKNKYNNHINRMIDNTSTNTPKYIQNLSEPWFTLITLGLKTVEGRKNKGVFKEMQVGDIVEWQNKDFKMRSVKTRITDKAIYKTFEEYLIKEGLQKCLPGIPSIDHGLSVYFKYFTKEEETEFGVVAIRLEVL
ncbi:ASCH domain protein [Klosneuvirus KNV1]|uniref:ASCH domain protein n=1 Tax=Klosneuvirus KNV1 TaxID=1977640 RepID=A0A1V0SLG1_9VIRU|nr:ASCH domain protein [Klosneuvirus KNV1]